MSGILTVCHKRSTHCHTCNHSHVRTINSTTTTTLRCHALLFNYRFGLYASNCTPSRCCSKTRFASLTERLDSIEAPIDSLVNQQATFQTASTSLAESQTAIVMSITDPTERLDTLAFHLETLTAPSPLPYGDSLTCCPPYGGFLTCCPLHYFFIVGAPFSPKKSSIIKWRCMLSLGMPVMLKT